MRGPRGDHAQAFLSIAASDFFGKLGVVAGCNMDMWNQIWNLVTSNLRVFFIVLLGSALLIHNRPDDLTGAYGVGVRTFYYLALAGAFVGTVDFLRVHSPGWFKTIKDRKEARACQQADEEMTLRSINHLTEFQKQCLLKAINSADGDGLFRRLENIQRHHDGTTHWDVFQTLRERKIIVPSNPSQSLHATSYIEFWNLTPVIVKNRSSVIDKLG